MSDAIAVALNCIQELGNIIKSLQRLLCTCERIVANSGIICVVFPLPLLLYFPECLYFFPLHGLDIKPVCIYIYIYIYISVMQEN